MGKGDGRGRASERYKVGHSGAVGLGGTERRVRLGSRWVCTGGVRFCAPLLQPFLTGCRRALRAVPGAVLGFCNSCCYHSDCMMLVSPPTLPLNCSRRGCSFQKPMNWRKQGAVTTEIETSGRSISILSNWFTYQHVCGSTLYKRCDRHRVEEGWQCQLILECLQCARHYSEHFTCAHSFWP